MGIEHSEIYDLLYRLGLTANYTGFFHLAYAVRLCATEQDRLLLVTKWVYPEVARQYRTSWKAVERNIRTAGAVIWKQNRGLLEKLARHPLMEKPRNTRLLAILTSSLLPSQDGPLAAYGLGTEGGPAREDYNIREIYAK